MFKLAARVVISVAATVLITTKSIATHIIIVTTCTAIVSTISMTITITTANVLSLVVNIVIATSNSIIHLLALSLSCMYFCTYLYT